MNRIEELNETERENLNICIENMFKARNKPIPNDTNMFIDATIADIEQGIIDLLNYEVEE